MERQSKVVTKTREEIFFFIFLRIGVELEKLFMWNIDFRLGEISHEGKKKLRS